MRDVYNLGQQVRIPTSERARKSGEISPQTSSLRPHRYRSVRGLRRRRRRRCPNSQVGSCKRNSGGKREDITAEIYIASIRSRTTLK